MYCIVLYMLYGWILFIIFLYSYGRFLMNMIALSRLNWNFETIFKWIVVFNTYNSILSRHRLAKSYDVIYKFSSRFCLFFVFIYFFLFLFNVFLFDLLEFCVLFIVWLCILTIFFLTFPIEKQHRKIDIIIILSKGACCQM